MANSITIQIRGDTAANWTSKNPVPKDRELCYDKTNNQLKTGDGTTAWNSLKYTPEIVNGLTSTSANAALSAAQGKALADRITTLENNPSGTNVTVVDNLTSWSNTDALSANQGRLINSRISNFENFLSETSDMADFFGYGYFYNDGSFVDMYLYGFIISRRFPSSTKIKLLDLTISAYSTRDSKNYVISRGINAYNGLPTVLLYSPYSNNFKMKIKINTDVYSIDRFPTGVDPFILRESSLVYQYY